MGSDTLSILPQLRWGRGTIRRTVEGRAPARVVGDQSQDTLEIPQYFRRWNPHRHNAIGSQPLIASFIPLRPGTAFMRLPVHLDAQLRTVAVEIERIRSGRMLFAPVESPSTATKLLPQKHLGKGKRTPQRSGPAIRFARAFQHAARSRSSCATPSTMLRMVPLPETSSGRN